MRSGVHSITQCPSLISALGRSVCQPCQCYVYIYAFSRRFYPKRLTVHSGYTFNFYVPWELNPQTFALLTQCSTTEPQEHLCGHSIPGRTGLQRVPLSVSSTWKHSGTERLAVPSGVHRAVRAAIPCRSSASGHRASSSKHTRVQSQETGSLTGHLALWVPLPSMYNWFLPVQALVLSV